MTVTATGNDLKSPDALTGFFLRHAKAHWSGDVEAAKAFARMVVSDDSPIIRQAEFIGYDHQTNFHILKDVAISPKGEVIKPEKDGYFKIGHGQYLRRRFDQRKTLAWPTPKRSATSSKLKPSRSLISNTFRRKSTE